MQIVLWKRKKANIIYKNDNSVFRTHIKPLSKRTGGFIYLSEKFSDPNEYFQFTTRSLSDGSYKIKIVSEDNLGNKNTGTELSVNVKGYVLPPRLLLGAIVGNVVTLTWQHSSNGATSEYRVYGNGGNGTTINRDTVIKAINGSLTTTTFNVVNGTWLFVVEAYDGSTESENLNTVYLIAPSTSRIPESPGFGGTDESINKITGIYLERVSVGKVRIRFYWLYGDSAESFNIYHDDATGTMSYDTPKFSFNRQQTYIQEYITSQLHSDDEDKTYKFVVRSITSDGVEDGNTNEYSIKVDGDAPSNVVVISNSSVY